MQSRLEEEEQAKAALMGRIQRLTKLILVSTKNTIPPAPIPETSNHRRRHSFGEEEVLSCSTLKMDFWLKPHHILVLESCVLGICSWGFCNADAFPAYSMFVRCSLCINILYLIGHY